MADPKFGDCPHLVVSATKEKAVESQGAAHERRVRCRVPKGVNLPAHSWCEIEGVL